MYFIFENKFQSATIIFFQTSQLHKKANDMNVEVLPRIYAWIQFIKLLK